MKDRSQSFMQCSFGHTYSRPLSLLAATFLLICIDPISLTPLANHSLALAQTTEDRKAEADRLLQQGIQQLDTSQFRAALQSWQQALEIYREIGDRAGEGAALGNLGNAYADLGQYQRAIEFYEQALAIAREIGDRAGEGRALGNMGVLRANQNQPELAIAFLKQSVKVREAIRGDIRGLAPDLQQSYVDTVAGTYRRLADLLLSQGRILEAQQVLELLKVEELREFTGERARVTTEGIVLTEIEQQVIDKHDSLVAFGQTLNECQQSQCDRLNQLLDERELLTREFNETVQSFEAEMRRRLAQDRDAVLDTQDFSREAREIVESQPGTVLLYPFVLEDKLWLLWAAPGGVVNSIEVPVAGQKLGETVLRFRQLLGSPGSNLAEVQATAKQLHDWLIAPLQSELESNQIQHLVFALDRVTRYIPMAALFDGEHYLIETYSVATILSADLTDVRDRLPPGTQDISVLALGLSDAVPPDFNALSNVPTELDTIVREGRTDTQGIYSGLKFLNSDFDRLTLRTHLTNHQILHIATHGVFTPGRHDQSYLLLGTGEQFSISDIQALQDLGELNLVVLSACETALGETDQDGLEIAGIAFYFLNGGADTVIASLWQVNDRSTSQLMQQFYTTLAQSTSDVPVTRAAALRLAQLRLLQGETTNAGDGEGRSLADVRPRPGASNSAQTSPGLSHPYYWAPFILIGNGL
jgi:CHAT domain-containing protein